MAQKFRIEMLLPDDVDPSDLLDKMQEFAVDQAEEFPYQDEDYDDIELTEDMKEEIRQAVSVESVTEKPHPKFSFE